MNKGPGLLSRVQRTPEGLPMLEWGSHRSPNEGACLMEYVSVLAGLRFSDNPRCTHPALAQLARHVNDHVVSQQVRCRLAGFAPDLIGTASRDPRVPLTVVAACLRAALATRPEGRYLRHMLERVTVRLARLDDPRGSRRARCRDVLREPAAAAVSSAFRLARDHTHDFAGPGHDQQLCDMLGQAIADCRHLLAVDRESADGTVAPTRR